MPDPRPAFSYPEVGATGGALPPGYHHVDRQRPIGAGEVAMTAHLVRPDAAGHDAFIDRVTRELERRFGINHPTLQIEQGAACEHDRHDHAPHH